MLSRNKHLNVLVVAASLLVVVWACLHSLFGPLGVYDEGFALTNAWRLSVGERPHVDYWAAYPPGSSAVLAAVFSIFSPTLLVSRLVNMAWILLLLGSMYFMLSRFAERWVAALLVSLAAMWVAVALYPAYVSTPALALLAGTVALFGSALVERSSARAIFAGVLAGALVLLRHDFAVYFGFSSVLAWIALRWLPGPRDPVAARLAGRFFITYALSAGLCFSVYIYLTDWSQFLDQALVFPGTGMRDNRLLPVPSFLAIFSTGKLLWLSAWLVPLTMVACLLRVQGALSRFQPLELWSFCVLFTMGGLLTLQSHNRLDMAHQAPSMLLVLMCIGLLWRLWFAERITLRNGFLAVWLLLFLVYALLVGGRPLLSDRIPRCMAGFETAACRRSDQRQIQALDFLRQHVAAGEAVFVGNTRHDKIWVNDASLYFLLQRPIPVKWNEMHPGVVTREAVQKEMVHALERRAVQWVVLAHMPDSQEPNQSAISSGVTILDSYLATRYQTVYSNDKYQVKKLITTD